jgi:uncharacterized protein (DUF1778 family)
MGIPTERTRKDERLGIRVSAAQKATLERASRSMRMSTSEFVVREAVASAEEILAERTRFVLPQEQWEAFVARLDEPPREIPALVRALGRPSPFDE